VRHKDVGHQVVEFIASEEHVTRQPARQRGAGQGEHRRHVDDERADVHRSAKEVNQFVKGENLRTGRIDDDVRRL